jgi:hypothetical protein
MKRERVLEHARMVLGPVRFADAETRAQTVQILHHMLNEEFNALRRAERHPPREDETRDAHVIAQSQRFNAVELARAGYLAPWKKKLARLLKL